MSGAVDSLLSPSRPIVVGFRDSERGPAVLRWSAERARRTGQPVTMLHALPDPSLVLPVAAGGTPYENLVVQARQLMDNQERRTGEEYPDVRFTSIIHCGEIVDALLGMSEDAALVVVGADRIDSRTGDYLGSVGHQVALGSDCAVVVLPGQQQSAHTGGSGGVVVGVDGSPVSRAALRVAAREAAGSDQALTVVTSSGGKQTTDDGAASEPASVELDGLAGELQASYPKLRISRVIDQERAPDEALRHHGAGASLVVMGRHGRGARPGIRLGSVTHKLLLDPQDPVMVITG